MKDIILNLIPTFKHHFFNKNDVFNFIDPMTFLDTLTLEKQLQDLSKEMHIHTINIYIEDSSVCSDLYFSILYRLCKLYCKKVIPWTNFIKPSKVLINECDVINVWINNLSSEYISQVFNNIKAASQCNKIINIKAFDKNCFGYEYDYVQFLNKSMCKSFEILPFHSFYKDVPIDYTQFENTILRFCTYKKSIKFVFFNLLELERITKLDNYNTQSIFILPDNKFSTLNYTETSCYFEFFSEINQLLKKIDENEKKQENYCCNCTSKLYCMANYFKNFNYSGKSCCGCNNLINKWRLK